MLKTVFQILYFSYTSSVSNFQLRFEKGEDFDILVFYWSAKNYLVMI